MRRRSMSGPTRFSYRETRSNIDNVRKLLVQIDKPTKQVMIEARLVEVNANPEAELWNQLGGRRRQCHAVRRRSSYGASNPGRRPATTVNRRQRRDHGSWNTAQGKSIRQGTLNQ